jgi:Flp pilus assembly protein TadG
MRWHFANKQDKERGAVAAELAIIVLAFLLPLSIGVLDFTMYLNTRQIATNAANQALMTAMRHEDPTPVVEGYFTQAGLDIEKLQVKVLEVTVDLESETVPTGNQINLTVEYHLTDLIILPMIESLKDLEHLSVTAVGRGL